MLQAVIMGQLEKNKEKVPSPVPVKKVSKQIQVDSGHNYNRRKYSHHDFYKIFEPRPELSYDDVNIVQNEKWENEKSPRSIPRYIGAHTSGDLPQYSNGPKKLVRRETVIASWKVLKDEREKALGLPNKRRSKVSRTQSERLDAPPRRYSSKRKSVIYSYDHNKKSLNEEYILLSDNSDKDSLSSDNTEVLENPKISHLKNNSSLVKSSSLTKFKSLLARVFTGNKSIL